MRSILIPVACVFLVMAHFSRAKTQGDPEKPDFQKELSQLDTLRSNAGSPIKELEKQGKTLLAKYSDPQDQGRIFFQMAHVYAQSDIRLHSPMVMKYGRIALDHTFDLHLRSTLYSYLASAEIINPRELKFEKQRARSAEELLKGYREALALKLPMEAPELPIVEKLSREPGTGLEKEAAERLRKHQAQMKARQEAEFIRAMVGHRDLFLRQLTEMYHRPPGGKEELIRIATRILADKRLVEETISKIDPK